MGQWIDRLMMEFTYQTVGLRKAHKRGLFEPDKL